jgi:hypothetical protein
MTTSLRQGRCELVILLWGGLTEGLAASSVLAVWVGPPSDVRDFSTLLTEGKSLS